VTEIGDPEGRLATGLFLVVPNEVYASYLCRATPWGPLRTRGARSRQRPTWLAGTSNSSMEVSPESLLDVLKVLSRILAWWVRLYQFGITSTLHLRIFVRRQRMQIPETSNVEYRCKNILVVNRHDLDDQLTWSGIPFAICNTLRRGNVNLQYCHKLGYPNSRLAAISNRTLRTMSKNPFYRNASSRFYRKKLQPIVDEFLDKREESIILAIDSFVEIADLRCDRPLIFTSDSTRQQLIDFGYRGFDNFKLDSKNRMLALEKRAFENVDLFVYPSEWAANSAIANCGVPEAKIRIACYGANLSPEHVPSYLEAVKSGPWNQEEVCRLLFVGVDWERKGGDIAIRICDALNSIGVPSELTVVGTVPPNPTSETLRVIPFLDKRDPSQLEELLQLFRESSYFILPTQKECYGIVFCEAHSFGLRSLTCRVGGAQEIVDHGVTGFLADIGNDPAIFARLVADNFKDRNAYREMRARCRAAFEDTFNWSSWRKSFFDAVETIL